MLYIKKLYRIFRKKIDFALKVKKAKDAIENISFFLKSKGVHIIYVELPDPCKIKNLSDFEKDRIKNWCFDFNQYKNELPKLKQIYGNDVSEEYINSVFDGGIVVQGERRKVLLDFESERQHIINGRRLTTGQPQKFHNTIYTHGACTWRGTGVEDQETIASYLQERINQYMPDNYRVINSAIGRGSDIFDDFEIIKEQDYQYGDIVIIGSHGPIMASISEGFFQKYGIEFMETSSLFDRPHEYGEWFNDNTLHTNKRGNAVISRAIFDELCILNWLVRNEALNKDNKKTVLAKNDVFLRKGEKIYGDNPELLKYIDDIRKYKKEDANCLCGSIVMNCNPFTLGHRYLIEYAASQVDTLYIFVVEEDRSYFPFRDRLELVKQGTSDLNNVIVLPSGNFIISATTFPGYFYKNDLKEVKIDCTNDINVFAQYIAPALNIKVRFAGEEPLDPITNQYNDGMRELLPKYGMEFRVIPRKEDGSGVISASRVRKHSEKGEFDEIKRIVPETTYNYLISKYKK